MRPKAEYAYLDHDGVLAFAHRGGDRVAPENTLAAFQDAVDQGYRYLETDVHASADGVVYAFHDDDLQRMVGEPVAISTLNSKQIDALRVEGGHAIPRMADLFEAFPDARFNIDAKAWPVVEPLCRKPRRRSAFVLVRFPMVALKNWCNSSRMSAIALGLRAPCGFAAPR